MGERHSSYRDREMAWTEVCFLGTVHEMDTRNTQQASHVNKEERPPRGGPAGLAALTWRAPLLRRRLRARRPLSFTFQSRGNESPGGRGWAGGGQGWAGGDGPPSRCGSEPRPPAAARRARSSEEPFLRFSGVRRSRGGSVLAGHLRQVWC